MDEARVADKRKTCEGVLRGVAAVIPIHEVAGRLLDGRLLVRLTTP
jgi:hypothetical protein